MQVSWNQGYRRYKSQSLSSFYWPVLFLLLPFSPAFFFSCWMLKCENLQIHCKSVADYSIKRYKLHVAFYIFKFLLIENRFTAALLVMNTCVGSRSLTMLTKKSDHYPYSIITYGTKLLKCGWQWFDMNLPSQMCMYYTKQ